MMIKMNKMWFNRFFRAPMFSPQGFVVRAAIIAAGFALCHLLDWREHTTFLTGTSSEAGTGLRTSAALGTIYMAAYFGVVLLSPILLLAAGILFVWERFTTTQMRAEI
jgi:hypothetical protein